MGYSGEWWRIYFNGCQIVFNVWAEVDVTQVQRVSDSLKRGKRVKSKSYTFFLPTSKVGLLVHVSRSSEF